MNVGGWVRISVLLVNTAGAAGRTSTMGFPIGMLSVSEPAVLSRLRDAGFNSFLADPRGPFTYEDLSKEARRLGLTMLAKPQDFLDGKKDPADLPLLAWYLDDEPDVSGHSAEYLEALSKRVSRLDPGIQTFVLGRGAAAERYAGIGDVVMLDWYPVPHRALDSVADQLDAARAAAPAGKPLWMVVQAFDWREEPQRNPDKPRVGRFPEAEEIRFMTYLSVMHGAEGIFFFRLRHPDGRLLTDEPELWNRVAKTARELAALAPVWVGGKPAPLPFPSDPDGPEARCWSYGGRRYVVLANRSAEVPAAVAASVLGGTWRALFEDRRDPSDSLINKGGGWFLKPHQILVLESGWRPFGDED